MPERQIYNISLFEMAKRKGNERFPLRVKKNSGRNAKLQTAKTF